MLENFFAQCQMPCWNQRKLCRTVYCVLCTSLALASKKLYFFHSWNPIEIPVVLLAKYGHLADLIVW